MSYLTKDIDLWEQKPAQIEEINQCIYNHRSHSSWYYFDTMYIVKQAPQFGFYDGFKPGNSYLFQGHTENSNASKQLLDIRYDFIYMDITQDQQAGTVTYDMQIRNTLWDGKYIITKSQTNEPLSEKPKVTLSSNKRKLTIVCSGKDRFAIRVALHLSQQGTGVQTTPCAILNQTEFTEQFDEKETHMGMLINTETLKGINNATVTLRPCNEFGEIIDNGLPVRTAKTQGNLIYEGEPLFGLDPTNEKRNIVISHRERGAGLFKIEYGKVAKPGVYYALLTATFTAGSTVYSTSQLVKINKVQEKRRMIDFGDEKQYESQAYKGSIAEFTIQVKGINQYELYDTNLKESIAYQPATITITSEDKKQTQYTAITDKDGYLHVEIDFRGYYYETSKMEVLLHRNDIFSSESATHIIKHPWFKASTYAAIREECARENGADYILVTPGVHEKTGQESIYIKRNQTIAGINSEVEWATLDGKSSNIITVKKGKGSDNYTRATLVGLKFTDGNNAIYMQKYTHLVVKRCYFTNNKFPAAHYSGTCICNNSDEQSRRNRKQYMTVVMDSYFYNNQGNCIRSLGTTYLQNNLFKTDAWDKLKQPQPKVIYVESGDTHYRGNTSYINLGNKPKPSNHSFAKSLVYVEKHGTFNGKNPYQLHGDDTLPLADYDNKAYTYLIYYNPNVDINQEVICSPKKGREQLSTGHGAYPDKWIYSDGYYFETYDEGQHTGNTTNPWSKELLIPVSGGVYNEKTNSFLTGYTPIREEFKQNEQLDRLGA